MRRLFPAIVGFLLLLAPAPARGADEAPTVKTVAAIEALPPETRAVRLTLGSSELVAALVRRLPGLTSLVLHTPGNELETTSLELLRGFPKLTSLTLTGDAFLYDPEFAALGRLTTLRSLAMSLP